MSGGLNVISRTQKIIVEPASASVAITNVGMPGPIGPAGPVGPPGPGGPGTTPEWAHVGIVSGTFGTTAVPIGLTKVVGSAGITIANSIQLKVPKAGMYLVNAAITYQGGNQGWIVLGIDFYLANGTLSRSVAVVDQMGAGGWFLTTPSTAIFNMAINDYVRFNVTSSAAGQNLDGRSAISITELPSNIGPTIVPPGGNTGQVLVKKSTNDFDVGWADPT
jgi:hypothetical protein